MVTLLIDSNVWSYMVLGTPAHQAKIRLGLAALQAKYPGATLATSSICVAECLVAARKCADPAHAQQAEAAFRALFDATTVPCVPSTDAVLDRAATIRADGLRRSKLAGSQTAGSDGGKLKLPDAAIAASCFEFHPPAVLVTENDKDFRYLEAGVAKTVAGLVVERVGP